ncbi:MAG: YicC family protein [Cyclobacteriaceae bacterium]|nr:YicC family protein [Cyclobacteriaceae bacterium]
MTKSMTGFGLSSQTIEGFSVSVEVKSLNSKFADINLRMSSQFSSKEIEWRKRISDLLERGKISVVIEVTNDASEQTLIDQEQFAKYFSLYKNLGNNIEVSEQELFKLAMQAPGVFKTSNGYAIPEEVFKIIPSLIQKASKSCDEFRSQEGAELERKLREYLQSVQVNLKAIETLDSNRTARVTSRLKTALANLELDVEIDKNRFEQELVYYIEKFDINEEKVRLANHLKYLDEVLSLKEPIGKKLGFVSQEIGREINTIGSKANDAEIQRHVVAMKEELEKIKEQSLNIL